MTTNITVGSKWRHKKIRDRVIEVVDDRAAPNYEIEVIAVADHDHSAMVHIGFKTTMRGSVIEEYFEPADEPKRVKHRPDSLAGRFSVIATGETLYIECGDKSPTLKQQAVGASLRLYGYKFTIRTIKCIREDKPEWFNLIAVTKIEETAP